MIQPDRTPQNFRGQRDAQGKFSNSFDWPLSSVGTANVLAFEEAGEWRMLMSRRAAHLAHGGSWSLLGGYLDLTESEGPMQASRREIREESNGVLKLDAITPHALPAYLDYEDRYTGQCVSLGLLYLLPQAQVAALKQAVVERSMLNHEVTEFRILSLSNLEATFAVLDAEGGIGYASHRYHLREAQQFLLTHTNQRAA